MKNPKSPKTPAPGGKLYQINSGFPEPEVTPPTPAELLTKLTEFASKLTAFELEYRHSQHTENSRTVAVTGLDSLKNKAGSAPILKVKEPASKVSSEPPLDGTKIKAFPSSPAAAKSEKSSKGE